MTINYNRTGADRKPLIAAIAAITGAEAKYLGAVYNICLKKFKSVFACFFFIFCYKNFHSYHLTTIVILLRKKKRAIANVMLIL